MIRHILLVRFSEQIPGSVISELFDGIASLRGRLPGILAVQYGPNDSPESLDHGFSHGLVIDFADRDSLLTYGADPEHRAIGARIEELATGGLDGILVVDLELAQPASIQG